MFWSQEPLNKTLCYRFCCRPICPHPCNSATDVESRGVKAEPLWVLNQIVGLIIGPQNPQECPAHGLIKHN